MSREIKFEFLYKGLPLSSTNNDFNWHRKVFTLDQLCEKPLCKLSDMHESCELVAKRQFAEITCKKGDDIYDGDFVYVAGIGTCTVCLDGTVTQFLNDGYGYSYSEVMDDLEYAIGNIYQNPELNSDVDEHEQRHNYCQQSGVYIHDSSWSNSFGAVDEYRCTNCKSAIGVDEVSHHERFPHHSSCIYHKLESDSDD